MGVTLVLLYSNYTPFGGLHQIFLKKAGTVHLNPEAHTPLKFVATETGNPIETLFIEAINVLFQRRQAADPLIFRSVNSLCKLFYLH